MEKLASLPKNRNIFSQIETENFDLKTIPKPDTASNYRFMKFLEHFGSFLYPSQNPFNIKMVVENGSKKLVFSFSHHQIDIGYFHNSGDKLLFSFEQNFITNLQNFILEHLGLKKEQNTSLEKEYCFIIHHLLSFAKNSNFNSNLN